jgi:hypothetical protein
MQELANAVETAFVADDGRLDSLEAADVALDTRVDALEGAGGGGAVAVIQQVVLAADQAVVTFSAIPQTYRNLRLVGVARAAAADTTVRNVYVRFNDVATANQYDYETLTAQSTAVTAASVLFDAGAIGYAVGNSESAANFAPFECLIPNYTVAQRQVWLATAFARPAATAQLLHVGGTLNTALAITKISLYAGSPSSAVNWRARSAESPCTGRSEP